MLVPFRALRLWPAHLCLHPACAAQAIDEPAIVKVPVLDAIGIEYAFDLQLTQGFYILVAAFVATRWLQAYVREKNGLQ